jgi:hypothetical protein
MIDPALYARIQFSEGNVSCTISLVSISQTTCAKSNLARFYFAVFWVNYETQPGDAVYSGRDLGTALMNRQAQISAPGLDGGFLSPQQCFAVRKQRKIIHIA